MHRESNPVLFCAEDEQFNSSDQVKRNTYSRTNSYIAGYGHPLYGEADSTPVIPAPATETPATVSCKVDLPQLKNGAVGSAVMNAQILLISKGYYCGGRIVAGRESADRGAARFVNQLQSSRRHLQGTGRPLRRKGLLSESFGNQRAAGGGV